MKKVISVLLVLTLVLALAGCAAAKARVEPGSYVLDGLTSQTVLDFEGTDKVSVKVFVGGFQVFSEEGTYKLNDAKTEITLSFASPDADAEGIQTASQLDGTLTYSEDAEAGTIKIGAFEFTKAE